MSSLPALPNASLTTRRVPRPEQYKLALAYYTTYEEPGTNSDDKALELFSRSREKEHVEGAFMLGQMLFDKGDAASAVCARRGQDRLVRDDDPRHGEPCTLGAAPLFRRRGGPLGRSRATSQPS